MRQAGAGVLGDASEFRAAFDDFVPEGSATEGDINLLTDAVRLGALGRVADQIGQGADPVLAVESQGLRLAQQRGTQEAAGAQWALAVLAFARGDLDEPTLVGRFPAPADSLRRPTFTPTPPTLPPPPPPLEVPDTEIPARAPALPSTAAPIPSVRTVVTAPAPTRPVATPRRRRRALLWLAAACALGVVGAGTFAVLSSGDDSTGTPGADNSPTPDVPTVAAGTVIATDAVTPPALDEPAVLAGRVGGVTLTAAGEVESIGTGDHVEVAGPGDRLVAFTVAKGRCQIRKCRSWQKSGLKVLVGSEPVDLPAGGPTFVVAAPDDVSVQLQYDADQFDQRLNLADGTPTGDNIQVLARAERSVEVGGRKTVVPRSSDARVVFGSDDVRTVSVGQAKLFFFVGAKGLSRPDRAYLQVDVSYTTPDDPTASYFHLDQLSLEDAEGRPYPRRDLDPSTSFPETVFVVPGDFTSGTLVIGGTRDDVATGTQGSRIPYRLTLPRTPFQVEFPD